MVANIPGITLPGRVGLAHCREEFWQARATVTKVGQEFCQTMRLNQSVAPMCICNVESSKRWQHNRDIRPMARLALHVDASAVSFHDLARGRQTQAAASGARREEGAKDLGLHLRRDAIARVDKALGDFAVAVLRLDAELATARHRLNRIEDQIENG